MALRSEKLSLRDISDKVDLSKSSLGLYENVLRVLDLMGAGQLKNYLDA